MLAPVTHIIPLSKIRRARRLPIAGRVQVRLNQKVSATDVIAVSAMSGQHVLIDVRKALNITRGEDVDKLIERKVGEKLQKGDVVAQTGGLFSRVVRSPTEGVIVSIIGGQVMLELASSPIQLLAGIPGTVVELLPERGAVIESDGALLQGVWGNNRVDAGLLISLARSADEEIVRSRIDVSMRGAVILAGYCAQPEVFRAADELPLRGLILGSMSADLIPVANKVVFPVILLEGFGRLPINATAFNLLTSNEKRDTTLNAANWNSFTGERPEVVIPLPANGEIGAETDFFKAGQTVRIQGAPYQGIVGVLEQVRPGLTRMPNALRVPAADVRLENNEVIVAPLANLDVLE
jgi:hypothetical protein